MILKQCLILSGLISVLMISSALADSRDVTRVGRYLVEQNGPRVAQRDPLQATFSLTFPPTVYSIHDAITYLLNNTGYNLMPVRYQSVAAKNLLKQRLPLSDRQFGPMTVYLGLIALAGNAYQLLLDPEHRLVSFQLRKQFQSLYVDKSQSNWRG